VERVRERGDDRAAPERRAADPEDEQVLEPPAEILREGDRRVGGRAVARQVREPELSGAPPRLEPLEGGLRGGRERGEVLASESARGGIRSCR